MNYLSQFPRIRNCKNLLTAVFFGFLFTCAEGAEMSLQSLQKQGLTLVSNFLFDSPSGATLSTVKDSTNRASWSADLNGTAIVQGKGLRIRCNSEKGSAVAYLPLGEYAKARALWLFLELDGWKFAGDTLKSFYFGLGQRSDKMAAVMQVRIRGREGSCDLTCEALRSSEGATSGRPIKIGGTEGGPLALAIEYVESERRYAVYQIQKGGILDKLGEGKSSPLRNARNVHLLVRGNFASADDEHLDIRTIGIAVIP